MFIAGKLSERPRSVWSAAGPDTAGKLGENSGVDFSPRGAGM